MSLSAAIIVTDATDRLDACLTSLRGLVDEIVVVDTESDPEAADRSVTIAREHGAVVAREPDHAGSAAARNRSLDLASGDWILLVDADAQVLGDFDAVRALLAGADDRVGFRVPVVPRAGWTPHLQHRLWRNRPDLRFEGQVHESIVPAIRAVADAEHLRVERFDRVTVHRQGVGTDPVDPRGRDATRLRAALTRDPDRPCVCNELAQLYESSGDGERAIDTLRAGIASVRAREREKLGDRQLFTELIQHFLDRGVLDDELEELVEEARGRFERLPSVELAAARLAFASGRPRDALDPLDWLLALDDDAIIATEASYDARVFGEWAWGLLGLCQFALGDDTAAADAFSRAELLAPDDPSYGVRRRLAEARAGVLPA